MELSISNNAAISDRTYPEFLHMTPHRFLERSASSTIGFHVTPKGNASSILRKGFQIGGGYLAPTLHDAKAYGHGKPGWATLIVEAQVAKTAVGNNYGDIKEMVGPGEVDSLLRQGLDSGDALGLVARKAGYDSMRLIDPDDDDGGPQLVLFQTSAVKNGILFDPNNPPNWALGSSTGTHRFARTVLRLRKILASEGLGSFSKTRESAR